MKENISVEVDVDCDPDTAWELIGPFETMHNWFPGVVDTRLEGTGVGSIRHLTMADGSQFSDELTHQDRHQYRYIIVAGELPFENYQATVSVVDNRGVSTLTYQASIDVSEENRASSVDFLTDIYTRAFENAKAMLGDG